MANKSHWYDGWFYERFIAPHQDKMFAKIASLIPEGSRTLDVGCGTGRFELKYASRFSEITCLDLSQKNVRRTLKTAAENGLFNVRVIHGDASSLSGVVKGKFDFAVMTYVIHEIPARQRLKVLKDMADAAETIIIGDYLAPRPPGLSRWLNEAVEFAAGKQHYEGFKSYLDEGGLDGLAVKTGLKVIDEIRNDPVSSHIAVMKK